MDATKMVSAEEARGWLARVRPQSEPWSIETREPPDDEIPAIIEADEVEHERQPAAWINTMGIEGLLLNAPRLARTVVALHTRVAELEALCAGRTRPPSAEEAEEMSVAGQRLARRWHAVDRTGAVCPWPVRKVAP